VAVAEVAAVEVEAEAVEAAKEAILRGKAAHVTS
jgi:hypothetical protein